MIRRYIEHEPCQRIDSFSWMTKVNRVKRFRQLAYLAVLGWLMMFTASASAASVIDQVNAVARQLPDMRLLLITNDGLPGIQALAFSRFLEENKVGHWVSDDKELRKLLNPSIGANVEDQAMVDRLDSRRTVCMITLNKRDYSHERWDYWKNDWDLRERGKNLRLRINPTLVGNWAINHELYHCIAEYSKLYPIRSIPNETASSLYYEMGADLYAALTHLQQTGDREMIRAMVELRQMRLPFDREHFTGPALETVLNHQNEYSQRALQEKTPEQLARMAYDITNVIWQNPVKKIRMGVSGNPVVGTVLRWWAHYRLGRMDAVKIG